jgi:outer membrane biosynthesis protein TonB
VLARITYGLVVIALGCLIGGFFTRESNVLLFVSIGLSVVAIALVLVGWARRAREAPVGFDEDLAYARDDDDLLSDEELAFVEERPSRRTTTASRAKPKAAKPKAKAKPKPKATTAKRKPAAARKPKAKPATARKPQARPKRKPPRPGS